MTTYHSHRAAEYERDPNIRRLVAATQALVAAVQSGSSFALSDRRLAVERALEPFEAA